MKDLIRRLESLLGSEGAVYCTGTWVLVTDQATGAIYTAEEAEALARVWEGHLKDSEALEDREEREYMRGQAYSMACYCTYALREEEVPQEVRQALREESGLHRLTWGW